MPYSLRIPDVLRARIESASGGRMAEWILEACRMQLEAGRAHPVELLPSKQEETGSTPVPRSKPSLQELRSLCDEIKDRNAAAVGAAEYECLTHEAEVPVCGKRWWEDGTEYECLMDKGHKEQKHGLRGMVRVLDGA